MNIEKPRFKFNEMVHKPYYSTVTLKPSDRVESSFYFFNACPGTEIIDTINGDSIHRKLTLADTNWVNGRSVMPLDFVLYDFYVVPISGDKDLSQVVTTLELGLKNYIQCPASLITRDEKSYEVMDQWRKVCDEIKAKYPDKDENELEDKLPGKPRLPGELMIPIMFKSNERFSVNVKLFRAPKEVTRFQLVMDGIESRSIM